MDHGGRLSDGVLEVQPILITEIDLVTMCLLQREHMLEAQDMFRTSNKVTRPEKALILGFMAGSRGATRSLPLIIVNNIIT